LAYFPDFQETLLKSGKKLPAAFLYNVPYMYIKEFCKHPRNLSTNKRGFALCSLQNSLPIQNGLILNGSKYYFKVIIKLLKNEQLADHLLTEIYETKAL
jgi:hypothetical protein